MNILKKALLLTSLMLGMLLLTSHTTTDSSFFTDDDDFGVALVRAGSRSGEKECLPFNPDSCDARFCIWKASESTPTSVTVTISTMQQLWFFPIYEKTFSGQEFFGSDNVGIFEKPGLFQPYAGGDNPANIKVTIDGEIRSYYLIITPNCN